MTDNRPILELRHNGDSFGSGFEAIELDRPDANTGIFRGDLGARPRSWWRLYAARNGYKLREAR